MGAATFYFLIDSTMNDAMGAVNSGLNQVLVTLRNLPGQDVRLAVYSYAIGSMVVQALKNVGDISALDVKGATVSYRNLNQAIRVVCHDHVGNRSSLPRGNRTYLVVVTRGTSVPSLAADAKSSLTALGFEKVLLYGLGLSDPGVYGEFADELDYEFSCDSRSVKSCFQRLESRLKELASGSAAPGAQVSPAMPGRPSRPRPSGSRLTPRPSVQPGSVPVLEPILEPLPSVSVKTTSVVGSSDVAELERLRKELSKVTQEKAQLESKAEESRIALRLAGEHHDEDQQKILDLQRRLDMMSQSSSSVKGLQEQLLQSQSQAVLLQKRLEQSESEVARLNAALDRALMTHEAERSKLQKQLETSQGSGEKVVCLERQLSELGEKLRNAEAQVGTLEKHRSELEEKLSSKSLSLRDAEGRIRSLESSKSQLEAQAQATLLQTNMEQESSRKLADDLASSKDTVRKLERELEGMREQLEEAERQKEKAVRRASADVDDLKEEVHGLKAKLRKSEASVEASNERVEAAEVRAAKAEGALEDIRAELAELQKKTRPYLDNLRLHEQEAAQKKAAAEREAAARKRKEEEKQKQFEGDIEDVNLDEAIEF